MIRYKFQ